jgi:hypothetical protein
MENNLEVPNNENDFDSEPELATDDQITEAKEVIGPSRFRVFMRKALIWLAVIVVAFLAGVLVFYMALYKPLDRTYIETSNNLVQSNQTIAELQIKNNALVIQATGLDKEKTVLQSALDQADNQLILLSVMEDVSEGRLALMNNDVPGAKIALEKTSTSLESLAPVFSTVDATLASSLDQRLSLALSGMDKDMETAKVDLQLLSKSLKDIELVLFNK